MVEIVKNAGIVGMGGATFPTHVKLSVPPGKKAEFLIINGVECEPYLTSDHRTMLEKGEELMVGTTILMRVLGVKQAQIGIENNKPDAIAFLRELSKHYEGVRVTPLKVRYPQGGEKQLIAAVTGRQVPPPPGLPIDVGAVVCNASTTVAVYEAVQKRKPLVERIVTVTGKGMKTPSNYLVRMGTPIASLVKAAGGLPEGDVKVLNGGPMMGRAMVNLGSPVTKGCSGITILSGRDAVRRAPRRVDVVESDGRRGDHPHARTFQQGGAASRAGADHEGVGVGDVGCRDVRTGEIPHLGERLQDAPQEGNGAVGDDFHGFIFLLSR